MDCWQPCLGPIPFNIFIWTKVTRARCLFMKFVDDTKLGNIANTETNQIIMQEPCELE